VFLVFKNLIENGIKYNENVPAIINITYKTENQNHVFLFEDNGIGIDEKYHSIVFGMFKRLNHRGKYPGSGLGLSIVEKVIQKINGTVLLASSSLGKGSTFEIRIPIIDESEHVLIHKSYSFIDSK